jgi:hypothetical protein
MGNSVFLIEHNTYAAGTTDKQRYGVTFQKVDGGTPVHGEAFFADNGTPFTGQINTYRQNGNPGRVAGDPRPGATHFMAGGEANPNEYAAFRSDDRWDTGVVRNGRFGAVQAYTLDPGTLQQTPSCLALDAINGRLTSGDPNTDQISRFGGDIVCLDNGNFLVVVEDRSKLHNPDTCATAAIIAPDGSVVVDSFVIGAGSIWSNVAAHRGGFCVRLSGILKFYDNNGNFRGEVDQAEAYPASFIPFVFDAGRGDAVRIASHINSDYVFLAGNGMQTDVPAIWVAAFDAVNLTFAGLRNVSELMEYEGGTDEESLSYASLDRANLAVDALNRVAVAYEVLPFVTEWKMWSVAMRVLEFHPEDGTFSYLTPSFMTFQNALPSELHAREISCPAVAMTTKEICVAAKGGVNVNGHPEEGPNSAGETNFYTVFTHPDPQEDPTPPAQGLTVEWAGISTDGNQVTVSWQAEGSGTVVIQSSSSPDGPWAEETTITDPATTTSWTDPGTLQPQKYYKLD